MKKLLSIALLATLFSCSKEEAQPIENTITYSVECNSCYFTYEDQVWNRNNERFDAKTRSINVYGKALITFAHKDLKEAKLGVSQSVFAPDQKVVLQVLQNNKSILHESVVLGWQGVSEWVFNVEFK